MNIQSETINAETKFAKINDDKILAYRMFGSGSPIIFVNRFRGDLDSWDPAFLDPLAKKYKVIIFQYAGTGSSEGLQAQTNLEMAKDVIDLADYLHLKKFALAGWSLGGFVTQVALTEFANRITHAVLIGTRPPGKDATPPEQVFFEHALKPVNDLKDEEVLFFNPKYPGSLEAANKSHERLALRKTDKALPMTEDQWMVMLKATGFREDEYGTFDKMKHTKIPIYLSLVKMISVSP